MADMARAGDAFPSISWPLTGGGELTPASGEGWRVVVVYRGKHCGLCRKYLSQLNAMHGRFERAKIFLAAISADPPARARAQVDEGKLAFPVAYGLSVADMRTLGLYVSPPQPGSVDWPFAEPAVFVVNPEARLHVASISNAPFARPEPQALLEGIETARKEHAPIHGTMMRPADNASAGSLHA